MKKEKKKSMKRWLYKNTKVWDWFVLPLILYLLWLLIKERGFSAVRDYFFIFYRNCVREIMNYGTPTHWEKEQSEIYIYIYIYCIFWCHRLYIKKYYKHLFIKLLRCTNYIHCYINCKTFVLKFYNNYSSFIFYLGLYIV